MPARPWEAYYDIDGAEQFQPPEVVLAGNGVGTPAPAAELRRRASPEKRALFPDAVVRLCGVPLHEQPRC